MAKAEYRSVIRSRKLINQALVDLLLEKPLDKITVTDVVRKAEINRGTFYAHYADIPDAINHLIEQTFSTIREILTEQPRPLAEIPHILLQKIQMILEDDLDFYRKVTASSASTLLQEQLIGVVVEFLFQNEEKFGVENHDQFVLAIRFCAGGLINLYRDWFAGNLNLTLSELTQKAEQLLNTIIIVMAPAVFAQP